ncbi:MAG: hypothetical protein JKY99_00670 [Rhizobiales bacterium]|nr:hypothetical protein [Hyphomicrobiales bacterium]
MKIFSGTPIDTVLVNGRAADGERVSDTIVNIFIKGDASGISCTNVFDISFVNAAPTRLTANHCHGTTEFAVAPGQVLDMQEVHDGDLDELSSGIETASSDFKWSYFADAKMSALQFSVPETDNVLLFAECNRGDKFAIVYPLFAPSSLQLNETVQLSLVIDGERADKYEMVVRHFPYLEKPLVPGLRVSSSQVFFKKLAAGQLADFYVTTNAGIQTSLRIRLKGSAKPVRSFAAACSQR